MYEDISGRIVSLSVDVGMYRYFCMFAECISSHQLSSSITTRSLNLELVNSAGVAGQHTLCIDCAIVSLQPEVRGTLPCPRVHMSARDQAQVPALS